MCSSSLYLTILAGCLAVCWAKPADIVARVPSDYYAGTKWVLFRDNAVPNPPPNVIQAENEVQVLPNYDYPKPQEQLHELSVVTQPPYLDNYETHVVESKSHYNYNGLQNGQYHEYQNFDQQYKPQVKVTTFSVTEVPHTAVHVQSPGYYDYLRKKKNA